MNRPVSRDHRRESDRRDRARWQRLLAASAALLALAPLLGGCSALRPAGDGERRMTVYFERARSFYPQSRVKVMGYDVGRVDAVENVGARIRVRFHIRDDVPLPRGVNASIVPLNLVGERNLVLHPAWRPGQPKELSNTIEGPARTHVPVEVDDALESFTNLADALDPSKVRGALGKAARSVDGNGREFNAALEQGARLTDGIAAQDKELLEVARNLSRLAGVVRGREQVLGQMISDFGAATRVLSAERGEIQELIRGILDLTRHGDAIIRKYEGRLPADLAVLTRVALLLRGNAQRIGMLVKALPGIGGALTNGYGEDTRSLQIRFAGDAFLRTWLQGLTRQDGLPCPLPPPNSNCPWMRRGGAR